MPNMKIKYLIVISILIVAGVLTYAVPKPPRYQGTGILKSINLPSNIGQWTSQPMADNTINLNAKYTAYINDYKTIKYVHSNGAVIYLSVLDAGNFHNPRLCFTGSGYEAEEMPDTILGTNKVPASTIFFKKNTQSILLLYWMTINQKRVDWTKQKMQQLWYSLINKQRVGLIVRLDIPSEESSLKIMQELAIDLTNQLASSLSAQESSYVFGQ
jgi:EpsI family protein